VSADLSIHCPCCGNEIASLNITYNLTQMLASTASWPEDRWRAFTDQPARKVGRTILRTVEEMAKDPEPFRAMNPANGWGDYDQCIQGRLRAFGIACILAPKGSTVGTHL
jgi:hypothetical protein